MPIPQKINLAEKLSLFSEPFQPRIIGQVNEMHVKVVKLKGEFVWHHHDDEDEMFLVLKGRFHIRFRDGELALDPGEFVIVPRGVEHRPYADEEAHVMLFEPTSTVNTGTAGGPRTYAPTKI